jgi:hypothetical protein
MPSSSSNSDLLHLKEQFTLWRATRTNRRDPIPDALWQLAISLIGKYSITSICRACHLDPSSFKRRLNSTNSTAVSTSSSFIPIASPPNTVAASSSCRLVFERPCGSRLSISMDASNSSLLTSLVSSFLNSSYPS